MNAEPVVYYRLEELVPAEKSVSGRAYFTHLVDGRGLTLRLESSELAAALLARLKSEGREARLVRVTEEVVVSRAGEGMAGATG